jgi:putative sigma-54 modulation protein
VRTIVKGKNLDVAEDDRRFVASKMERLERFLDERSEAVVELSVEHHRDADDTRIVEVSLMVDGHPLRAVARAVTWKAATDEVIDRIERQAIGYKERRDDRRDGGRRPTQRTPESEAAREAGAGPRIVKVKRFAIEPVFEEDAVARMEELGHSFYVFVNAESERVSVVYRRADGDYGLIEPVVGGSYTAGG